MKRLFASLLLVMLITQLAGCGPKSPASISGISSQTIAEIDRLLAEPHDAQLTFNGVALVTKDGNILLHKAYGMADSKKNIPLTVETLMPVLGWDYYNAFLIPATILLMADQGKLSLEDPVCPFIPDCPKTWDAITIKDILSFTSRLPDPLEGLTSAEVEKLLTSSTSFEDSIAIIRDKPLVTIKAPATAHWTWVTYDIQYRIIGEILGDQNISYLIENFIEPLGITHMGKKYTTDIAAGHTAQQINTDISPLHDTIQYPKWMISNAKEVYLVLQELLDPKILSESAKKFIRTEVSFDNDSLTANFLGITNSGLSIPGSAYSWNFPEGYSGTYFVAPEDRVIIVICSNQKDRDFQNIVQDILDKLTD